MRLRGFRDDTDYGKLPFRDAWSLHRTELIAILADRVPHSHAHFRKRLVAYQYDHDASPITLSFADATTATCDVLVGADGLRSVVRAQMMARDTSLASHVHPRWTGTIAYRALVPVADISARNPDHRILKGGAVVSRRIHCKFPPLTFPPCSTLEKARYVCPHDYHIPLISLM